jgi:hypothetical protein
VWATVLIALALSARISATLVAASAGTLLVAAAFCWSVAFGALGWMIVARRGTDRPRPALRG